MINDFNYRILFTDWWIDSILLIKIPLKFQSIIRFFYFMSEVHVFVRLTHLYCYIILSYFVTRLTMQDVLTASCLERKAEVQKSKTKAANPVKHKTASNKANCWHRGFLWRKYYRTLTITRPKRPLYNNSA